MKQSYFRTKYIRVFLCLFLLSSINLCSAQEDPWGNEEKSFFEETGILSNNNNTLHHSIFEEPTVSENGYWNGGFLTNKPKPIDPRGVFTPSFPSGPDVPINGAVILLIIVGLSYGAYTTKVKKFKLIETVKIFVKNKLEIKFNS